MIQFKKISKMLGWFHSNEWVEIRLLNVPQHGTVRGYYKDYEKAERDIMKYDGQVNIYMTLNSISPDVANRSLNRLHRFAKETTSDKEIIRRNWLMIDFDPQRPSGISANEQELQSAWELAEQVQEYLENMEFTEPVVAMSGNGYHLLYPVDLPNTPEVTKLFKEFLRVLDDKFSNGMVGIDRTTYNASRITKLYGTISCKGDETEERPHRRSGILTIPDRLLPVDIEAISKVAKISKQKSQKERSANPGAFIKVLGAKQWLEANGMEIDHEKQLDNGGICYVLKICPWDESHTDKSAYVIQFPNGKIVAGCHHDSCCEKDWNSLLQMFHESSENVKQIQASETGEESAADIILAEVALQGHILFHDNSNAGFVEIPGDFTRYFPIHSKEYGQLLRYFYYTKYRKTISRDVLKQVQDTLESEAVYNGEERAVYTRCAALDGVIYYYIADPEETVIAIEETGYRVCEKSPVPFIRRANMLKQVMPVTCKETLTGLTKRHWKFKNADDKMLHDILLVTRFIPGIPTPIVLYMGTRGSAKSTSMIQDKMVTDPNAVKIKALPRNTRDVVTSLTSQYMVCFDNIDKISTEISDLFCIASTGGYYTTRKLYTDSDEHSIQLNTRLNLTSINMPTNRPDLYDRSIVLTLKRLDENERKTEEEVIALFEKDLPKLLHAIFDTLSKAILVRSKLMVEKLPRMADFALWGYAIAEVLNYGGEGFLDVYCKNQQELTDKVIEEDVLATTLITFCNSYYFLGSMTELLVDLTKYAETQGVDTTHGWVKTPGTLSRRLNELETLLNEYGIHFNRTKPGGNRTIELWLEGATYEEN